MSTGYKKYMTNDPHLEHEYLKYDPTPSKVVSDRVFNTLMACVGITLLLSITFY